MRILKRNAVRSGPRYRRTPLARHPSHACQEGIAKQAKTQRCRNIRREKDNRRNLATAQAEQHVSYQAKVKFFLSFFLSFLPSFFPTRPCTSASPSARLPTSIRHGARHGAMVTRPLMGSCFQLSADGQVRQEICRH